MPYKDPEQQRRYLREYHERRVAFVEEAKAGHCVDCGQSYPPYVMDFDHVRGEKVADVNHLRNRSSWQRLAEEIAKCDLVCANCHRERTHQRALVAQLVEAAASSPA